MIQTKAVNQQSLQHSRSWGLLQLRRVHPTSVPQAFLQLRWARSTSVPLALLQLQKAHPTSVPRALLQLLGAHPTSVPRPLQFLSTQMLSTSVALLSTSVALSVVSTEMISTSVLQPSVLPIPQPWLVAFLIIAQVRVVARLWPAPLWQVARTSCLGGQVPLWRCQLPQGSQT